MVITEQEFSTKYLSRLNENQLRAVHTVDGPILLLAVPGSGKTTVLVNRLGYMIFCKGINPDSILALTYNRAAIRDMSDRFAKVFGEENRNLVEFRTINGICQKIIMRYANMIGKSAFSLCDDDKLLAKVITDIMVKKFVEYPTESEVKAVKSLITYCKNMLLNEEEIEQIGGEADIPFFSDIFREYNEYLRNNSKMDYDDQMIYAYRMLKGSPKLLEYYREQYKYICVDEAQDTSKVQHIIIGLLAGENGNLFMVGDEDQSIYGFRAAYPEALLNFEINHPNAKVLVMDQNYRSNAKIVMAADSFIQHNKNRHEKHMVSTRSAANDINYVELPKRSNQYKYLAKVARNCKKETAVLYRDNECVLPLIDLLEREQIAYRIRNIDMGFFTNRVVLDVIDILKFALNPSDTELFLKIYYKCKTYLKKYQAEALCRISSEEDIPILSAISQVGSINGRVKKQCKALRTNLASMTTEPPAKAIFRIENPMGYGEYLKQKDIPDNKLYILKMLAVNETTIEGFINRLEYLNDLLKNMKPNYSSNFILSTIHSSKGLEYDQVYLMDVCDGVLPMQIIKSSSASKQDKKNYEEDRRLFYVGMTRAKNDLSIFRYKDNSSYFIKDLLPEVDKANISTANSKDKTNQLKGHNRLASANKSYANPYANKANRAIDAPSLKVGDIVITKNKQVGKVVGVTMDTSENIKKFEVRFPNAGTKTFAYPQAFANGMKKGL